MTAPLMSALIYLLGFVGLASIGLLPLRSWQVLRRSLRSTPPAAKNLLPAFVVLVTAGALWTDVQITTRIFRCLTETYCGPGVASGWTYLAMLGVVYLAFEAMAFMVQKIGRPRTIS